MNRIENLIIGGGFTALELARRLGSATIVAEDVGGLIRSYETDGFLFDLGGHVYTMDDPYIRELMMTVGAQVHTRRAYYLTGDKWVEYPVQAHAADLGITLQPEEVSTTSNLANYAISVFGREFWEKFLGPFNERVWSVPPHLLSRDWIYGRIKLPSECDEKWGMNAQFAYAPGYHITRELLKRARGCNIMTGIVTAIDYDTHHVYTTAGTFNYTNLFDTTGLAITDSMAGTLRHNYVAAIGVGFGERLPFDFHWVYGRLGQPVHRITMLSRYHQETTPGWGDSLLLEVPAITHYRLPLSVSMLSDSSIPYPDRVKLALHLVELAGLSSYEELSAYNPMVLFVKTVRAYPIPLLGARKVVAKRKAELLKHNVYTLGRWGSHGYFNLQHLVKDVDATIDIFQHRVNDTEHPYFTASFYYKV